MRAFALLFLLAAVCFSVTAGETEAKPNDAARKGPSGGPGKDGPLAQIIEHAQDLGLSDEQVAKLKALREELAEKVKEQMQANREKAQQDPAMRELMQQMRQAKESGDQAKLEELKKQYGEKAGRPNMDGKREKIAAILTPEQLQKLKEYMDAKRGDSPFDGARAEKGQKPDSNKAAPDVFKADGDDSKKTE